MSVDHMVIRLDRPVLGSRQQGLSPLTFDLAGRSERKVLEPPKLSGGKPSRWEAKPRELHPTVRPEPNAPQLIRLVRTPYQEDVARPRRQAVREPRPRLEAREPTPSALRTVREELPTLTFATPAGQRPRLELERRPWRTRLSDEEGR